MTLFRSLRARIATWFALSVIASAVLYAAAPIVIFLMHERDEALAHAAGTNWEVDERAQNRGVVIGFVVSAVAVTAVAAAGAAAVGLWVAGKALAPLRDAAERASAARAGSLEPLLPLRGMDDEWDVLARAVNDLLRDQRRLLEMARSFNVNAAHELRTPLTAILGEAQVALRHDRSAEEYRATLREVEAEATRLRAVLETLLTLSRVDSGEMGARAEPFDLSAVAADASRHGSRAAPAAVGLDLSHAIAHGDPVLTRRVLENLIDNAVRHAARGVEVRVWAADGVAAASVSDDGPGLPPSVRARLFERFNREPGASSGFGLGLSIAHALAAAQGGRLYLDGSTPATRFVLELPRATGS